MLKIGSLICYLVKCFWVYYNLFQLFYNRAGHKISKYVFCGWTYPESSPMTICIKKMETGDHSVHCPFTVVLFPTFTLIYLWRQHNQGSFLPVFNSHFLTHLAANPTGEKLWDSLHPAKAFQHHLEDINVCDFSYALGICNPVGSFPH